ncbi:MAG: HTTM domain-containing protein [Haloferacaceae archaeon]
MTAPDGTRSAARRLRRALGRHLGVDARALAALRVGLGLLLVADLLGRARDIRAFYTDAGVLPRSAHAELTAEWFRSVHLLSGDLWFQALLFVVAAVAATVLTVGYRTRTATAVSWLLLVSLHNRMPVVLNGGDVLLRMVLLWAIFLPLGARWAVDARRRADGATRDRTGRVASLASAGLLLQVVTMYSVNAALKLSGTLWVEGSAIRYVFSLEQFTTPVGALLATHPELLVAVDRVWLALVTGSVLLVLLRGWPRAALVGAFAGGHLSMYLTMRLGLFPFIACVALLAFLPPVVWDRLAEGADRVDVRPGRALAAADRVLPRLPTLPPPGRVRETLATLAVVCVLVLAVLGNVQPATTVRDRVPDAADPVLDLAVDARPAVYATRTDQYWTMFAPEPMRTDGWYVVPARLENDSRVDALHRRPVRWTTPDDVAASYPNARWRKYLVNLWRPGFAPYRDHLADYLCRRWNATHETDIVALDLYYVEQPGRLSGPEPTNPVLLEEHRCGTAP